MSHSNTETSKLYKAYRGNEIGLVEKLIPTMNKQQIDRIEPNGSTALHADVFHRYGRHCEIDSKDIRKSNMK